MKRRIDLWGYAGLALLAAAILWRALVLGPGTPALVLAILGGLLLLVYFVRAGQSVDRFLARRSTRAGGTVAGTTFFVIGIAILTNAIANQAGFRLDLTQDRIFTVAPETRAALQRAPEPPEVWVFYPESSAPAIQWRTLLEGAKDADPRLRVHVVDPAREPMQALRFDLRTYGTVIAVGERFETVTEVDEEAFVSALVRASRRERPLIGFLEGHGERAMSGPAPEELRNAALALDRRGYRPVNLHLMRGDTLDSVAVIVVAGPQTPLAPAETESLLVFLGRGGRLLIALDPVSSLDLHGLLIPIGLAYLPQFVSDPESRDPQLLYLRDYSTHPAVKALLEQGIQVLFAGTGEILLGKTAPSWKQASLIRSGSQSRLAVVPESEPRSRVVAAAAEGSRGAVTARVIVFGDADFMSNRYFDFLGNGDLLLASIEWLSDHESEIALRPRPRTHRPILVSRQQGRALMVVLAGILPLGVAGAGFLVLWRRR